MQGASNWLFPFVNGAPPIGWHDASAYLVLPVLLVVSQYVSQKVISPPSNDESQQNAQWILKFLPLMIGGCCSPPLVFPAWRILLPPLSPAHPHFCSKRHELSVFLWGCAGWFSLNVPSGLTIYWFVNNILSTVQQVRT